MAAERLIALHANKGKTIARSLIAKLAGFFFVIVKVLPHVIAEHLSQPLGLTFAAFSVII